MKQVEKLLGVNTAEVGDLLPTLKKAQSRMITDYIKTTHPKLKMLDGLILFSLCTLIAQIVYAQILVRDRDPFNSFLAGVFCSLGQFALAGKS